MDAYTLTTPRTKHHWSSGLTIVCWMMVTIPVTAIAARPVLYPGGQRYRDSSPPSVGRSGSATLVARALVGRNGETTVEVSTSTLDTAAPAPGNISRLQLKVMDSKGRLLNLRNHNGLSSGGRLQFLVPGLGRGLTLQLQANIRGIDPHRTDVVTLRTPVRRRPDLRVQRLSAPESTSARAPVMISALVEEVNGDTGAEADCVLRVDGLEVDRAPGIWVDAASAVSCAFTYAFPSAGMHTLSVEAADVVPGDDDPANNQATASIHVVDGERYHHEATVTSGEWRTVTRQEGWYTESNDSSTRRSDWFSDYEYFGWQQRVDFRGEFPTEVTFPLTLFLLVHSSGGASLPPTAFQGLLPVGSSPCVWAADPLTGGNLTLCAEAGRTHFAYTRYGGEVTYYSRYYEATWITDMETGTTSYSDWSLNSAGSMAWGAGWWTAGTSYDFDVRLLNGPTTYRATASVVLQPYENLIETPYTCTSYSGDDYTSESCSRSEYRTQGVNGSYVSSDP